MADKKGGFDASMVRELAAILREADLGEIEIEHDDLRVRVSRQSSLPAPQTVIAAVPTSTVPVAAPTPVASATAAAQTPAPTDFDGEVVPSPMVGTAYLSPDPNSAPFIKEGDTVKAGDTLCLIEAMKTFNPVTAPKGGKITKILVSNEQPVEYDEPLVVIA